MKARRFILKLSERRLPPKVGNKALNLRWLLDRGYAIPPTWVCSWDAYQMYLDDNPSIVDILRQELVQQLDLTKPYAVRSSANLEDGDQRSYAGQFKTVLDLSGVDAILQAIWSVWATASAKGVQTYRERQGSPSGPLMMAVIIQQMVQPVAAGVALSRNPMTGSDEVVIEAVLGRGDALVQSGVTPLRWVFKRGRWLTQPLENSVPVSLVEQIVHQTQLIARQKKCDVDLEWAWDGQKLYWLQVRRITALQQHNVYSSRMSKEMLPGMIKPLVWSVNIPLKSSVFVRFLNELLGDTGVRPEELIKAFYYRVYFNMGVIGQAFTRLGLPADSVEMMTGMNSMEGRRMLRPTARLLLRLPRMISFAHKNWLFHRRMRRALPDLEEQVRALKWQSAGSMSVAELESELDRLTEVMREVTYVNILCPILAVMHTRMLEGELKRAGTDLAHFNISDDLTELADYDPAVQLQRLHSAFLQLPQADQEAIRSATYEQFINLPGISDFQNRLSDFISRFGHLSDNGNDFSCSPWRENPDMVLRLVIEYTQSEEPRTQKLKLADLKINPIRRKMVKIFIERVRQYRLLREQLSKLYTFTYGLYRVYYLALADHLVKAGLLDTPEDIFYLSDRQVRQLANGHPMECDHRVEINRHKDNMEKLKDIRLPEVIYGEKAPPLEVKFDHKLTGLGTSIGCYTGPVKVVRGIQDFHKVKTGDVLVIPYSDVGWSPLFANAGAVVAESGGLLSHSSIIAREYGIPAVVSVSGAMTLCDQMCVTVDGYTGEILVHTS